MNKKKVTSLYRTQTVQVISTGALRYTGKVTVLGK